VNVIKFTITTHRVASAQHFWLQTPFPHFQLPCKCN